MTRREYVVFRDEAGEYFVIWADMVKRCLFCGSTGDLFEVERGFIEKPDSEIDTIYMLKKLLEKQREYYSK